MLNIGVFTTNEKCADTICQRISESKNKSFVFNEYSYLNAKTCNMILVDMDSMDCVDELKENVGGLRSVLTILISGDDLLLKPHQCLFKVHKKPVLRHDMHRWVREAADLMKCDFLPNVEEDRLYNAVGIKTSDLLKIDPEMLEESRRNFEKYVSDHYKGPNEQELMRSVGLEDVHIDPQPEEVTVVARRDTKIDFEAQFVENALTRFRIRKMASENMNKEEIEKKLTNLVKTDIRASDAEDDVSDSVIQKTIKHNKFVQREIERNDVGRAQKDNITRQENVTSEEKARENQGSSVQQKAKNLLTPEQLETLRKLGVKI